MTLFTTGIELLVLILSISLALCFLRLYRGPDVPNRVVAFDLIAVHAVAIIALFAIEQGAMFLLDVTIITGVLGFLGTVMVARYLEQSKGEE
ncbi:MAG: monovalent cation/H+ antiporter complex subunit F [Caldilineaceae bacterium]